jgi:hypothetical protein
MLKTVAIATKRSSLFILVFTLLFCLARPSTAAHFLEGIWASDQYVNDGITYTQNIAFAGTKGMVEIRPYGGSMMAFELEQVQYGSSTVSYVISSYTDGKRWTAKYQKIDERHIYLETMVEGVYQMVRYTYKSNRLDDDAYAAAASAASGCNSVGIGGILLLFALVVVMSATKRCKS